MRIRFSIRTILIVVTLVAVIVGPWLFGSTSQKATVAILRQNGCNITYRPTGKLRAWIGVHIGSDFVAAPLGVYCNGEARMEEVTVAGRRQIRIAYRNADFDDADLATVSKLGALQFIILNGTDVTDNGIKHLAGMTLDTLDLSELPITDACVDDLARIDTLRWVTISPNTLTAHGQQRLLAAIPECTITVQPR